VHVLPSGTASSRQPLTLHTIIVEAIMQKEGGHVVQTPVEARAGFLDRPVLVVLAAGLALVVVAFALIYGGYFGT
jgi:hypothetical protein